MDSGVILTQGQYDGKLLRRRGRGRAGLNTLSTPTGMARLTVWVWCHVTSDTLQGVEDDWVDDKGVFVCISQL